jgi:hypothetical protein
VALIKDEKPHLKEYAVIKGYLRAIYVVSRDWIEKPKSDNITKISELIFEFFSNLGIMFTDSNARLIENKKKFLIIFLISRCRYNMNYKEKVYLREIVLGPINIYKR